MFNWTTRALKLLVAHAPRQRFHDGLGDVGFALGALMLSGCIASGVEDDLLPESGGGAAEQRDPASGVSETGDDHVRYAAELRQGGDQDVTLEPNDVPLGIEGRASATPDATGDTPTSVTSSVAFNKCSGTQQSTVLDALFAASVMANDASSYLNGTASATVRYTTWFGAFTTSRWNTAKAHFAAIKAALDTKPIKVDCSCTRSEYAYVNPASPYTIYVCKAFWSAPMTGTDSKGGTFVNQMSRFTAVAGTDSYVYGQASAKSLAKTDPVSALDSADNHEYFAENAPSLP